MFKLLREMDIKKLVPIFLSSFFMTFGNRVGQFGILFYLWFTIKDASVIGVILLVQMIGKASSGLLFYILSRWISPGTLFSGSMILFILACSLYFVLLSQNKKKEAFTHN